MHSAEGDCSVLVKLGGQTARKQEKGKGWAYCLLGMYDGQYDESMSHLENDQNSYELLEMQQCPDFFWMVSEYYKEQPMPGFRVCQEDECKSLGELSNGEDSKMVSL